MTFSLRKKIRRKNKMAKLSKKSTAVEDNVVEFVQDKESTTEKSVLTPEEKEVIQSNEENER